MKRTDTGLVTIGLLATVLISWLLFKLYSVEKLRKKMDSMVECQCADTMDSHAELMDKLTGLVMSAAAGSLEAQKFVTTFGKAIEPIRTHILATHYPDMDKLPTLGEVQQSFREWKMEMDREYAELRMLRAKQKGHEQ